jgi:hypothetical protein
MKLSLARPSRAHREVRKRSSGSPPAIQRIGYAHVDVSSDQVVMGMPIVRYRR